MAGQSVMGDLDFGVLMHADREAVAALRRGEPRRGPEVDRLAGGAGRAVGVGVLPAGELARRRPERAQRLAWAVGLERVCLAEEIERVRRWFDGERASAGSEARHRGEERTGGAGLSLSPHRGRSAAPLPAGRGEDGEGTGCEQPVAPGGGRARARSLPVAAREEVAARSGSVPSCLRACVPSPGDPHAQG